MSTYSDVILADNPAVFLRLDIVGPGSDGQTVPDSSVNGLDGTLVYSGTVTPWGYASPIETDAGSREFRGMNAVLVGATEDITSRITVPHDAALAVTTDFSCEGWLRPNSDIPSAGTFPGIQKQGSGGIGFGFSGGTKFVGYCFDTAVTLWSVYSTITATDYLGESFHVVVVRLGATLALYLNGRLNNSITITSGLGTLANSSPFNIHGPGSNVMDVRYDEAAFYTHALTATQVLAHYEAAKASLPLNATLTTRVVVELDTDATIPVDFPFAHNFAEAIAGTERPLVEHLAFRTNVNQSEPDYQQRINAQPYHLERTIETAVTPVNARGRAMMQAALWKPGNTYPLPVSNDWSELTSSSAVAATILNLDTRWRDYEVGSYVGVWSDVFNPATYQRFRITSVTDTQLGITPAVVTLLPAGSVAMPARLACLPEDTLALESHLIDTESAVLQFEVLATELSTRRVTAYTPAATYKSIEVFSLVRAKVEWADPVSPVSRQLVRRVSTTGNPTGSDYQRALDSGSPQTIPLRVLCLTRQSISEFYGWLAARQGKQNPVWVVSQDNDLPVTATTATTATIAKIGYTAQYNVHGARRDVAFLKTDGSYVYKRITAAVDNGDGTETLTMAATLPALATIVRTSFLKFCTAPDVYEIHYHRAGTEFLAECAFVLTELLTTPA